MNYTNPLPQSQEYMDIWFKGLLDENGELTANGSVGKMRARLTGCNFENRTLELVHPILPWEINPQNALHGGLISAAFDTTLSILGEYFCYPYALVTVTLNVTFCSPVFLESENLHIESKIDFLGKSLISVSGIAWTEDKNSPVATATSTLKILSKERS